MCKKLFSGILLYFLFSTAMQAQQRDTLKLYFDIDQSAIGGENARLLDGMLAGKEIGEVDIYGYTDFLGDVEYNRALSARRSAGVKNYLVSKGLKGSSIKVSRGMGVFPNSSESSRRDMSDKGIRNHRMVSVVYSYGDKRAADIVPMEEKLSEKNLVVGKNIVLDNIFFYNNSDVFRPESNPTLAVLLKTMKDNPTLKIEIQGYVCCTPNADDVNDDNGWHISRIRAEAVYDYLAKNGINTSRMAHKGYGRTNKRFPLERDDYEMDMNRRVEILILEK